MGRKNWLFSDTQAGADASMMIYSLVETAKANGVNPERYLQFLLEKRPNENLFDADLESLMPWQEEVKNQCNSKQE